MPTDRKSPNYFGLRSDVALAALLAAIVLALYWPATGYEFLNFDDERYVAGNPIVLHGLSLPGLRWAFTTVHESWWLPVLWISYMLDADLFGPEPFGFHLSNILLHAANAALLFWLLFRMTGSRWRSLFVAALFALHPLRVESVAWIAERKDVLSGFFFLLSLLGYVRYAEKPSSIRFGMVHVWMILGLMSKAMLVILPVVLLVLDGWPLRRAGDPFGKGARTRWRPLLLEKVWLFGLAAAFVLLNLYTHRSTLVTPDGVSWTARISLIFPNYGDYVAKIFWPAHLSIIYPPNDVVSWTRSALAAAGLLAVTVMAFRRRQDQPYLLVGWLWFLIALFPVIRGVRFDDLLAYADRYTYLPSMGLGMAVVWAVADGFPEWRHRRVGLAALGLTTVILCAGLSRAYLPTWTNSMTVFENILKYEPDHVKAHTNLGEYLLGAGELERARHHFEAAMAGGAQDLLPYSNLGMTLVLLDRAAEAVSRMDEARVRLNVDSDLLSFVTGVAYLEINEAEKAIPYFERAVRAPVMTPITWRAELARAYREAGHLPAYSNELARIAQSGFHNLASYEGLCMYYMGLWQHGHGRRAWTFFQRELEREPDNMILLNNTAWFLATDPPAGAGPADALSLARRAKQLGGEHVSPSVLDTLAVAYAAAGDFEQAVHWAEAARAQALSSGMTDLATQIEGRIRAFEEDKAWGRTGPERR